jgi:predicted O-methyltransferase YrrM
VVPVTLDELGIKYATDRTSHSHNYLPKYERMFAAEMRARCRAVLELGVLTGAGILMWRDYFPSASVVGVDLEDWRDKDPFASANQWRIASIVGDYLDDETVDEVRAAVFHRSFDLIVDDGDHDHASNRRAFHLYWPLLAPGGVYVCEDIWPDGHGLDYKVRANKVPDDCCRAVVIESEAGLAKGMAPIDRLCALFWKDDVIVTAD